MSVRLVAKVSCKHGLSMPRGGLASALGLRGGYDLRPGPEAGALGCMGEW